MKTVIAIYIVAILALAGWLIYMNNIVNSAQHEYTSAVTTCEDNWHAPLVPCATPLVLHQSDQRILGVEYYQGGEDNTGYNLQPADVNIQ